MLELLLDGQDVRHRRLVLKETNVVDLCNSKLVLGTYVNLEPVAAEAF